MAARSNTHQERRRRPRFVIDLPFDCRRPDAFDICAGIAVNASDTGLLIHSRKDFPFGTKLMITVFFPQGFQLDNFEAIGKVVWKDLRLTEEEKDSGFDYGVVITQIKEGELMKLQSLLKENRNIEPFFATVRTFEREGISSPW